LTKPARPERIEPCCVERSNSRADTLACAARTAGRAKKTTEVFAPRLRSVSQPLAGFDARVRKPRPRFPIAGGVLLLMRRNSSATVALGNRTRRGSPSPMLDWVHEPRRRLAIPLLAGGVRLPVLLRQSTRTAGRSSPNRRGRVREPSNIARRASRWREHNGFPRDAGRDYSSWLGSMWRRPCRI
jgi:hypothetical protein